MGVCLGSLSVFHAESFEGINKCASLADKLYHVGKQSRRHINGKESKSLLLYNKSNDKESDVC